MNYLLEKIAGELEKLFSNSSMKFQIVEHNREDGSVPSDDDMLFSVENGDLYDKFNLRFYDEKAVIKLSTISSSKTAHSDMVNGVGTSTFSFSSSMWHGGKEFSVANPNIASDIHQVILEILKTSKMMYEGTMQFVVVGEEHGLGNDGSWSRTDLITKPTEEE